VSCYKDAPEGTLIFNPKVLKRSGSIEGHLFRSGAKAMKPKALFVAVAVILLGSLIWVSAQTSNDAKPKSAIRAVIEAQAAAWNRGDIEGYMDGYERSSDIAFVSGDRVSRGWQTVLDRYKKGYDSREKMGTLTFSDLDITIISSDAALVLGRWHLRRSKDEPRGRFTLLFRKTRSGWKIVHDHTSSAT
jgi:ketosteroid isomerase-like protein